MTDAQTVTVKILDKEYQVSCKLEEVDALKRSAAYLDEKMREVKTSSPILGLDRIAVMAALNIANDFLQENRRNETVVEAQADDLRNLGGKLDLALDRLRSGVG